MEQLKDRLPFANTDGGARAYARCPCTPLPHNPLVSIGPWKQGWRVKPRPDNGVGPRAPSPHASQSYAWSQILTVHIVPHSHNDPGWVACRVELVLASLRMRMLSGWPVWSQMDQDVRHLLPDADQADHHGRCAVLTWPPGG